MNAIVVVSDRDIINNKWLGHSLFHVLDIYPRGKSAHLVMDWYKIKSPGIIPTDIRVLPYLPLAHGLSITAMLTPEGIEALKVKQQSGTS